MKGTGGEGVREGGGMKSLAMRSPGGEDSCERKVMRMKGPGGERAGWWKVLG